MNFLTNELNKHNRGTTMIKLQSKIFYLYILLLPVMAIKPLNNLRGTLGVFANNNFWIHLVGLLLILVSLLIVEKGKIKTSKLVNYIFLMALMLNTSSLLMSIVLYNYLGVVNGETTLQAFLGMFVLYSHLFLMFYYNFRMMNITSMVKISKLIDIIVMYTIVVGYLQILVIEVPFISSIYDKLNVFGFVRESSFIKTISRITLTGLEPSSAGGALSLIIMPYLLSKILYKNTKKIIISIFLTFPIIIYTKSSTVLIMSIINIIVFSILLFRRKKLSHIKFLLIFIVTITSIIFIFYGAYFPSSNNTVSQTYYLIFEKIADNENQSTLYRTSTVINDINVFKKYPLFGIGNGNQGFYYNDSINEKKFFKSQEVVSAYSGKLGIVNGGPFIPAYISGYGIFGVFLLIIFIKKSYYQIFSQRTEIGYFYEFYIISSITFLITSVLTHDIVLNYMAVFVLSFPFLNIGNSFEKEVR